HRWERASPYTEIATDTSAGETTESETVFTPHTETIDTLYTELRAPIFGETAPAWFLHNLEVQVAVRRDSEDHAFTAVTLTNAPPANAHFSATAYTAGAKISPTRWLTLRGSYATGDQPPIFTSLLETDPIITTAPLATDPMRGDSPLGQDGVYTALRGGFPS